MLAVTSKTVIIILSTSLSPAEEITSSGICKKKRNKQPRQIKVLKQQNKLVAETEEVILMKVVRNLVSKVARNDASVLV